MDLYSSIGFVFGFVFHFMVLCMDLYGFVRIEMDLYGFVFVFVLDLYGFVPAKKAVTQNYPRPEIAESISDKVQFRIML